MDAAQWAEHIETLHQIRDWISITAQQTDAMRQLWLWLVFMAGATAGAGVAG